MMLGVLGMLLVGCGTAEKRAQSGSAAVDGAVVPDAVPRAEPLSRYGNMPSYVVNGRRYFTLTSSQGYAERGIASWYGADFHGRLTSSRDVYDMHAMTAAHPSLPLPSYVEVVNLENNRRVVVRVNDRGPFHSNRIIDLSYAAARKLDMVGPGTALVEVRAVGPEPEGTVRVASNQARSAPEGRNSAPLIFVQAGAFAERENAIRLKARLEGHADTNVRIAEERDSERTLFRVQLGPLESVEATDALVQRLAQFGIERPQVVVD